MKIQTDIDNYDLRFEHYPGTGESESLPACSTNVSKIPLSFIITRAPAVTTISSGTHALSATSYGAEVELMLGVARYFNGGTAISKILQRTSALLNVAYIHSRVELGPRAGIQDKDRGLYGRVPLPGECGGALYGRRPRAEAQRRLQHHRQAPDGGRAASTAPMFTKCPGTAADIGFRRSSVKYSS